MPPFVLNLHSLARAFVCVTTCSLTFDLFAQLKYYNKYALGSHMTSYLYLCKSNKDLSPVLQIPTSPNRMLQWCHDHTGNIVMDITMFYIILLVINVTLLYIYFYVYFYCGLKIIRWYGFLKTN